MARSYLTSDLHAIANRMNRAHDAVKAGAELVEQDAKMRAPDASPHGEGLVAAIHTEQVGPAEFAVIAGDKDVFWGHFQEFGTVNHGAQPFLLPAFEAKKRDVMDLVKRAVRRY